MLRQIPSRLVQSRPYICTECMCRRSANQTSRRVFPGSTRTNKSQSNVLALLEERGYINQIAGDRNVLEDLLSTRKLSFYAGVDPTAPSLHLGHLLPIMVLFWVSLYGHSAVSLVGGGTARVGDPSGRLTSRAETAEDVQASNAEAMFAQTARLWESATRYARRHGREMEGYKLLNNHEWLQRLNILDFLKLLGNGMRVGTMLGRDTVRNKMEKGDGMSFSEFTYPLLQGWDWWHMYNTMGVQIQIGGSDQYGNIIAGMDAVKYIALHHQDALDPRLVNEGRFKDESPPMGLTVPLLTTPSGEKFGKSAGNAIWLDRQMTSAFDLYGFLLRSSDADVERYLNLFTFVPKAEIEATMTEHNIDPGRRKAQHLLASEVLELVHGREEAERTRAQHEAMRSPSIATISSQENLGANQAASKEGSTKRIQLPESQVLNTPFARILHQAGLVSTRSAGARLIAEGGLYVASKDPLSERQELSFTQIKDPMAKAVESLLVDGMLVLRIGKWKVRVVQVE